jgi:hypothetical protein
MPAVHRRRHHRQHQRRRGWLNWLLHRALRLLPVMIAFNDGLTPGCGGVLCLLVKIGGGAFSFDAALASSWQGAARLRGTLPGRHRRQEGAAAVCGFRGFGHGSVLSV